MLSFKEFLWEEENKFAIDDLFKEPRVGGFEDAVKLLRRDVKSKFLGRGLYAHVYKCKNKAIKIGKYNDKCWFQFAEFVKDKRNKHYPKISRLKAFPKQKYFVAEMELLEPFKEVDFEKINDVYILVFFEMDSFAVGFEDLDNKIQKIRLEKFPKSAENDLFVFHGSHLDWQKYMERHQAHKFISGVLNLRVIMKGCRYDLHEENFMWRGKTLIINDPIAP